MRYSAFDRYTKLAQQALDRMQQSARDLDGLRTTLKPLDPTEKQILRSDRPMTMFHGTMSSRRCTPAA